MNWLAHLYLSPPDPVWRLGNLLPDFLPSGQHAEANEAFQPGMTLHRFIDQYTDAHPIVRQSCQRIPPPFRRFAGVLVDVFYDHFLTQQWTRWSDVPLEEFIADFYASIEVHHRELPELALTRLRQIRDNDYLTSYAHRDGIERVLQRLGSRLRRPFPLHDAMTIFDRQHQALEGDFDSFFPSLRASCESFVAAQSTNRNSLESIKT